MRVGGLSVLLVALALLTICCAGCSDRAQSAGTPHHGAPDHGHAGEPQAGFERHVRIEADGRVTIRRTGGGQDSRAASSGKGADEFGVAPAFTVEIVCDSFGEVRSGSRPRSPSADAVKDQQLEDHLVHWRIESRVYSWWSELLAELRRRRADPATSYTDPIAKAVVVRPVVVRMGPNTTFQDFVRTVDFLLDAGFEDLRVREDSKR